jgi:hypothetical protein
MRRAAFAVLTVAPLRLHFGGADHGFSFQGPAWDPVAADADACVESLRAVLAAR